MEQTTIDDLPHIQAIWPSFEQLVGLRRRKMYARADEPSNSYTVCTPLLEGDDPQRLGLSIGTLRGGRYLRGRIVGDPPESYGKISTGMAELEAATPKDAGRPVVEFYRRHDQIELWVPITD